MPTEYFFISAVHIGGDGQLQNCDFEAELLELLQHIEQKQGAELIINEDAFGRWEFTTIEGPEKLEALIKQQSKLFEQFKATGSKITITIMPGNHDYELACYPEYIDRLKDYNLNLVQKTSIAREVAGKKLWIEHGQRHDETNRMPQFGNPYAEPVGYFVTRGIVGASRAGANPRRHNRARRGFCGGAARAVLRRAIRGAARRLRRRDDSIGHSRGSDRLADCAIL
jgi:UDP-2,3-diacylglucosamine pyrophosphatase LpxH